MRVFVDSADLAEIAEWDAHPWVSGFTTNPTLMRALKGMPFTDHAMSWAKELVSITDKPVSIDGPPEVCELGRNVWRKTTYRSDALDTPGRTNHTAICCENQVEGAYHREDIISVFAGRIMDTGRYPTKVIARAQETGALVLWASVREPYNLIQAEQAGCDIVTVPPTILRKYIEWQNKPLENVARETISQFKKDSEGLW